MATATPEVLVVPTRESVPDLCAELVLSITVLGASGDLAKKKTYPALYALYRQNFLPKHLQIVGYARSALTDEKLRAQLKPYIKGDTAVVDEFLSLCSYCQGSYSEDAGFQGLEAALTGWETNYEGAPVGRLFYLALPPSVYPQVCQGLKTNNSDFAALAHPKSWLRVIVEKPFGQDLETSEVMASKLGSLFPEHMLYRIDHYLGKELSQNMLVMRFANPIFSSWWNRLYISNIQITFKEDFGTQGRGGYFDSFGIIRDVMQNHLMQVMALLCMEAPASLHPDDIRDEKLKVLRCMPPVKPTDCVLGQYTAANDQPGYLDDPTVPAGSKTPTYACVKLLVNNERWSGVPIIMKAGKALEERATTVRVQLRPMAVPLFGDLDHMRNELVMRFQPGEAIYCKMVVKKPGLQVHPEMSELDLSYAERYADVHIPDAYERLILDCIRGDQQHFVRRDELRAAWTIFTPLLHAIDKGDVPIVEYPYGSRGPSNVDEFLASAGYSRTEKYIWRPKSLAVPSA